MVGKDRGYVLGRNWYSQPQNASVYIMRVYGAGIYFN